MIVELETILVGVDGSVHARRATEWAATLARAVGGTVVVVHALGLLHRRPDGTMVPSDGARDEIRAELEDDWCAPLRDAGIEYRAELREGTPVRALMTAADELDADVIVLGSRGAGGFAGLRLGSTSQQVTQHSRRPVVIIPPNEQLEPDAN